MVTRVESIDDERLSDYREVREHSLLSRGLFLAEGANVVRRLLASPLRVRSVLLAENRVEEMAPLVPPGTAVFVLPGRDVSRVMGFTFHSGVIAVGRVPASARLTRAIPATGPARVLLLPEISSAENLGSILRLAAGLGAHAVICGPRCTSPWMRRTVRVSMGTVFAVPVILATDWTQVLTELCGRFGLTLVATVVGRDAEPLAGRPMPERVGVMLGSEAQGLSDDDIAAAGRRVTIPMATGVDSLNVALAAGIVMWELFTRGKSLETTETSTTMP